MAMKMNLIILGSGTGTPLGHRASPSLVIMINGEPILFDIGPGAIRQLTKVGLNHEALRRIFLTHFHPDHTADLVHFLFATRNPSTLRKRQPFVITGARGLNEFLRRLQEAYGHWLSIPPEIMGIEELDVKDKIERDYGNFKIIACRTTHTPESIAYRVEAGPGSVVYSGDTGFCDDIIDLAKGADLLILESSFPDGKEVEGHLTPSQAGRLAHLAGVPRLLLIHFYPECLKTDIAAQCRKSYGGELTVGSDLLHIDI
jgi:ribonuclease BN (tRNA processing enzyme)